MVFPPEKCPRIWKSNKTRRNQLVPWWTHARLPFMVDAQHVNGHRLPGLLLLLFKCSLWRQMVNFLRNRSSTLMSRRFTFGPQVFSRFSPVFTSKCRCFSPNNWSKAQWAKEQATSAQQSTREVILNWAESSREWQQCLLDDRAVDVAATCFFNFFSMKCFLLLLLIIQRQRAKINNKKKNHWELIKSLTCRKCE